MFLLNSLLLSKVTVYISKDLNITNISKRELSNLFLKKTNTLNGQKITVIDNIEDHEEFYRKVLNKTPSQIHAYWMKQVFLGKKTPPKKYIRDKIAKRVNNSKNIIWYSSKKIEGTVLYESK